MKVFKTFAGHTDTCSCDARTNARGQDDDRRQIVADLISLNESPFMPDDEDSLRSMSEITLRQLRNRYATAKPRVHHTNDDTDPACMAMTAHTLQAAVAAATQQWSRDNAEGITRHDVFAKMLRDGKPEPETESGVALAAMNADPALEAMSAPSSLAVFKAMGMSTRGRR